MQVSELSRGGFTQSTAEDLFELGVYSKPGPKLQANSRLRKELVTLLTALCLLSSISIIHHNLKLSCFPVKDRIKFSQGTSILPSNSSCPFSPS